MCTKPFLSSAGLGYSSVMECLHSNVNGPRFNPQNWERKGGGEEVYSQPHFQYRQKVERIQTPQWMHECKMLYLYNGILASSRRVWNNEDDSTDDFLNFFLSNRRQSQGKHPLHISGVYSHTYIEKIEQWLAGNTYVEKAEQWLAGTWREGLPGL